MKEKLICKLFLLVSIPLLFVNTACQNTQKTFFVNEGLVYGTYYRFTYEHHTDIENDLKAAMAEVGKSLSTFDNTSVISLINNNDSSVNIDKHFKAVYTTAQLVSSYTNGAFDITVAPLVNAWGFGFDPQKERSKQIIDSIMLFVGYNKITLKNGKMIKQDTRTQLDASAIAKGYACDVVAQVLREAGVENFLVDIGGEIVVKGQNSRGKNWQVGINKAIDDATQQNQEIQQIISVTDVAIATSGNYRQFYYENNKKIAHTIDPRTGYPTNHSLLSTTVIAPTCMLADAYATAFMVMGNWEEIMEVVNNAVPTVAVFCIFEDATGKHIEMASPGFEQYLQEK